MLLLLGHSHSTHWSNARSLHGVRGSGRSGGRRGSRHSTLEGMGTKHLTVLLHHHSLILHHHPLLLSYHHLLLYHSCMRISSHHHVSTPEWGIRLSKLSIPSLTLHRVRLHLLEHVDVLNNRLLASEFLQGFGISLCLSLFDLHVQDSELTFLLSDWIFFVIIGCE